MKVVFVTRCVLLKEVLLKQPTSGPLREQCSEEIGM